jgi:hypothetical protein
MKHELYTILIFVLLFIFSGCYRKQQTYEALPVIDIIEGIEDEGTTMALSEIADDITFIPLETNDECLIGFICSICFYEDYIVL